jgi:hypothetical protein
VAFRVMFLNFISELENSEFYLKNGQKLLKKPVWVETREFKFCMNMLCLLQHQTSYSDLDFFEICLSVILRFLKFSWKNVNKKSKSVWVEAGELKFCMNMLHYDVFKGWFSDFEVLEKKAYSLVCNMWKVDTHQIFPFSYAFTTSASSFLKFISRCNIFIFLFWFS